MWAKKYLSETRKISATSFFIFFRDFWRLSMKRLFFVVCVLLIVSLTGCNGVGNKDTLIARIGNENVYQEDLNLLYNPDFGDFDSEKNMEAYENLFYEAAFIGRILQENPQYEEQWKSYSALIEDRVLALAYQNIFIKQGLGYSEEELKNFFNQRRADFEGAPVYSAVRSKLAEQYYMHKAKDSLERFIQKTLPDYDIPEDVHIALFESDSAWASAMADTLNSGISLDTLHDLRSIHVTKGSETGIWKDSLFNRAVFSADSMKVGEARMLAANVANVRRFFAIKVVARKPSVEAKLEDKLPAIEKNFVEQRRNFLMENFQNQLKENKDYVVEELKPVDPKKFYEEHADLFRTVPGYELYHVGVSDSLILDSIKRQGLMNDLESFKDIAAKQSEVKATAVKGGLLGKVKVDYSIPYGVGLMPELFKELAGKGENYVSAIYRSANDGLYHVFYVSAVIPSEVKPYERAKAGISAVYANDFRTVDSSAVIISRKGKTVLREVDVRRIFTEEMHWEDSDRETHNKLVAMILGSSIAAEIARKEKIDHSWYYLASIREVRRNFILRHYRTDLDLQKNISADSTYRKFLNNLLPYDYKMEGDALCSGKNFQDCEKDLLRKNILKYEMDLIQRKEMESWNMVRSSFFDSKWEALCPKSVPQDVLNKAAEVMTAGNFDKSVKLYELVLRTYADDDTVFQNTMLNLAQAYADAGRYDNAEKNYEAFYTIWPEHPEAEKAMFSRGFVLNENLHKDKVALQVLEAFCKKYPKSDLKESADWLMANIKSSGKLADDLMKKIDAEGN